MEGKVVKAYRNRELPRHKTLHSKIHHDALIHFSA
jgi:hypothetical protein